MKKMSKKMISLAVVLAMIVSANTYAGVNGGTEDIVAPTAAAELSEDGENSIVVSRENSGYNSLATMSNKSPLEPMGFSASIGRGPSDQITSIPNGPYDTSVTQGNATIPDLSALTVAQGVANMLPNIAVGFQEVEGYQKGTSVDSPTAILVNATTRKIYFGKNYDKTYLPAGLGNLMTAYLAVTHKNLDDVLEVHTSAVKGIDKDAAIAALNNGDTITLRDALGAMFTKGCVDCANVIAENVSGSIDAFVELMNTTAKEIGCQNTSFKNPSGLDAEGQVTTAYDVALIMDKLTEYSEVIELMSQVEYMLPKVSRRDQLILYSKNTMMSKDSQHYNPAIKCSRLGYTKNAEYTLASEFTYGNNKFIAVVLKSKGTHFADTKKMYEYARVAFDAGK